MCIYLKGQNGLHYDSADHIIPAGIGGMKKLPFEYVSREFNNLSSKIEQTLMRKSIISLPRQIVGPGKKGSLNPGKATNSAVTVFRQYPDNGTFSLGYIRRGKPYEVPHFTWNTETSAFSFSMNKNSTDKDIQLFKQKLNEFNKLRIRMIKYQDLGPSTFLLGVMSDIEENIDCFIASNDGINHPFDDKTLEQMTTLVKNSSSFNVRTDYKVQAHQNVVINVDYYRCCAKIAFNCLAYLKGQDFVLNKTFNPIRNWIVNGGENRFGSMIPKWDSHVQKAFPEDSHQVLITKKDNNLVARICLYGHFHNLILLTDNYSEFFDLDGYICDWKTQTEFKFNDYLTHL